ncbi:hypothetical protein CQ011_03280 [Arthrobacter sp. MYb213]|nr:hypothetical protein CQ011_03280 [Arthrobacter sp. MYb213]
MWLNFELQNRVITLEAVQTWVSLDAEKSMDFAFGHLTWSKIQLLRAERSFIHFSAVRTGSYFD